LNAVAELISSLHVPNHARVACPECSHERKKYNQKDLDIITKPDGWKYYCHHCQAGGFVPFNSNNFKPIPRMEQNVIPIRKFEETKLQPQHYDFLKTRGISEQTADAMKLFPAEKYFQRLNKKTDAIGFPYFKNGKFISAKLSGSIC
jgi:hypothetical protein